MNYKKKDFEGSCYPHFPPKEGERCKRVISNGGIVQYDVIYRVDSGMEGKRS